MPFDRFKKALRSTDTESVRKAANDEELTPALREEAEKILEERGEGKEK